MWPSRGKLRHLSAHGAQWQPWPLPLRSGTAPCHLVGPPSSCPSTGSPKSWGPSPVRWSKELRQLDDYISDRQVEIMEEEAHWIGLFWKLTADPKNMAVPGLLYSEVWVESLCSTQRWENKQKPLANCLWAQDRRHFENGLRTQAAIDFGGFQHSPVVPFSRMQIRLFCGTKQRGPKQLDDVQSLGWIHFWLKLALI